MARVSTDTLGALPSPPISPLDEHFLAIESDYRTSFRQYNDSPPASLKTLTRCLSAFRGLEASNHVEGYDMVHSQDGYTRSTSLGHSSDLLSGIDQRIIPPTDLSSLSFELGNENQSEKIPRSNNISREERPDEKFPLPESKHDALQQTLPRASPPRRAVGIPRSGEYKARCTRSSLSPGGKIKQGLAGRVNGCRVSAIADTGSRKNIISAVYAAEIGLKIQGSPSSFTLGNSRQTLSLGTVSLFWSFAADPEKIVSVVCDVLPQCIYDLILGNGFLTATETMSKYRHRLTQCIFTMGKKLSAFAFLGEGCQRLEGILGDTYNVLAVPDTGAERNVMSWQFVIDHDLYLKEGPEHRNWLQFADGSFEETVGQVDTYWTFATGKRIPVTFEVLEECCSDVIIGEEICTQQNVFEDHGSSLIILDSLSDSYELAPFDFIIGWKRLLGLKKGRKSEHDQDHESNPHLREQRRRDTWNYAFNYGASASTGEKELEKVRRSLYDDERSISRRMPLIPSIPTAPSTHLPPHRSGPRSGGRSTQ